MNKKTSKISMFFIVLLILTLFSFFNMVFASSSSLLDSTYKKEQQYTPQEMTEKIIDVLIEQGEKGGIKYIGLFDDNEDQKGLILAGALYLKSLDNVSSSELSGVLHNNNNEMILETGIDKPLTWYIEEAKNMLFDVKDNIKDERTKQFMDAINNETVRGIALVFDNTNYYSHLVIMQNNSHAIT